MTVTATRITREEAKEQARERLTEVLVEVVPGFRPERAFRCLNPSHEDRHPSARYLSRANMVKCFSCGWSGDVFDVVGAVYGLDKADAFAKTYGILGLDPRSGGYSRPAKSPKPKPKPGTWDEIISLIYPPGWDAPEPEVKLPLPLEVITEAETGLVGRLAVHPDAVKICIEVGLEGWHFDDAEIGRFYDEICIGVPVERDDPEFTDWLKEKAAPVHMVRKRAVFIVEEGLRRGLEAVFASVYSLWQNGEPPRKLLAILLGKAGDIIRKRCIAPEVDDAACAQALSDAFGRYDAGDNPIAILADICQTFGIENAAMSGADAVDALIGDVISESDRALAAMCELYGLDREAVEERAAILEFDGALPRVKANRLAAAYALHAIAPRIPEQAARWLFDNAATAMAYGKAHGLTLSQIADELHMCFYRRFGMGAAALGKAE